MSAARIVILAVLAGMAASCEPSGDTADSGPAAVPAPPLTDSPAGDTRRPDSTPGPHDAVGTALSTPPAPPEAEAAADPAPRAAQPTPDSAGTASSRTEPPAPSVEPVEPPAGQDVARLLRRTASIYSAMRSMQAEFTMLTRNPLLRTEVTSHGTLFQRRPDRILLRFTDPAGDVIVGDGKYFWVYYPSVDPKQVVRTPAAGTAGVVDLQAQFVGDPLTRFEHTVRGREAIDGRDATAVMLVPREVLDYDSLEVWIDTQDSLVRRFQITDPNGVSRRLDLRNLEVDADLPDDLFTFTPPEGVRIVERG